MVFVEKFIWRFAEWCLNTRLLEMASDRNDKMSKIESKCKTINEHLFKYFLMPNSIDRIHWLNELDTRFNEILDIKWNKTKRFHSYEYFSMLYDYFFLKDKNFINYKYISKIFNKIENHYENEYRKKYDIDDFVERVGPFLKEISNLLESDDYDKDILFEKVKIFDDEKY
jgi:hypothetical protein